MISTQVKNYSMTTYFLSPTLMGWDKKEHTCKNVQAMRTISSQAWFRYIVTDNRKCSTWQILVVTLKKASSKSVSLSVIQHSVFGYCIPSRMHREQRNNAKPYTLKSKQRSWHVFEFNQAETVNFYHNS